MEQITPCLRRSGSFYEVDGEPLRRVVGRARTERDPFDVLWELRESARELLGGELPDDTYPDELIRRTVGGQRPVPEAEASATSPASSAPPAGEWPLPP